MFSARPSARALTIVTALGLMAAACTSDPAPNTATDTATTTTVVEATTTTTEAPAEPEPTDSEADPSAIENAGAATLNDPYVGSFGNGGYDVQAYDLDITWDQAATQLDGITTITATATQTLGSFNLDLYKLDVTAATVNGEAAEFGRDGNELTIIPSEEIADGADFTAVITYGGTPQMEPGRLGSSAPSGWHTLADSAYVLGEPIAASTFHPANDHPSDKANFTYRLTASDGQVAIAGGTPISETDNGDGTTTWVYEHDEPLATYLTTMMFGDFEVREDGTSASGIPIRNVFYAPLADQAEPIFKNQPAMMDAFEEMFGPYPFDLYGSAVVNDVIGGALETQTLSVYGNDVLRFGPFAERIVAHELAHQWFGNSVSVQNWEDLWLNEGFASYAEALWLERSDPTFNMDNWLAEAAAQGPLLRELVHRPPQDELFGAQVYTRGAVTLHALRLEVGDDLFFEILRTWTDRFRNENATTADFEALVEELANKDLSAFFDAWLRTEEPPTIDGFDTSKADSGDFLTLDEVRDLLREYDTCLEGEGSDLGTDPATADPNDLIDAIETVVVESPAAHAACEALIAPLAG